MIQQKRWNPFDENGPTKKVRVEGSSQPLKTVSNVGNSGIDKRALNSTPQSIQNNLNVKLNHFAHNGSGQNTKNSPGSLGKFSNGKDLNAIKEKLLVSRKRLHVFASRKAILRKLFPADTLILMAGTGSGKTTQMPQVIYKSGVMRGGCIACTQPRRVAAISIARRVADEMGTNLGQLVGYRVRFDDTTSSESKVIYMTDGMLLREALLDPLLKKYTVILLDEAHERTVNTDVLFGVVKAAQKRRAEHGSHRLKVVVMSATMDADQFSAYFDGAAGIVIQGRQHPLTLVHIKKTKEEYDYMHKALVALFKIHENQAANKDVLVFLTGQEEIENFIEAAKQWANECIGKPALIFCPMYSSLPQSQLLQIFNKTPLGCRKVVVATNIAETSVTISGVRFVIDTGVVKARSFNPLSGYDVLAVQQISQAQAIQREGRATREAPGICYRTYSEAEFNNFSAKTIPEIQRTSMVTVVLQLLKMGIRDINNFDFMDKPPPESISNALNQLYWLGAVEDDTIPKLTPLGVQMAAFPIDPRLAKVLLSGKDFECLEDALTIVSMLATESVLVNPTAKAKEAAVVRQKFCALEGDHLTLLNIFRAYKKSKGNPQWCQENFINARNMKIVSETRSQLRDICVKMDLPLQSTRNSSNIRKCFVSGFFMNASEYQLDGYVTVLSKQQVLIHPSSVLHGFKTSCIIFNELVQTNKLYMRNVCTVDPTWLEELTPASFRARKPYKSTGSIDS